MTPNQHKKHENIPDHPNKNKMTDFELIFTMLGGKIITVNSEQEKSEPTKPYTLKTKCKNHSKITHL